MKLYWNMFTDNEAPAFKVAWGGRAIWNGTRLDLPADRHTGFIGERSSELDAHFQSFLSAGFKWVEASKLPGDSCEVVEYDEEDMHLRATPNKSYGYMYLTAWMEA